MRGQTEYIQHFSSAFDVASLAHLRLGDLLRRILLSAHLFEIISLEKIIFEVWGFVVGR